MMFLWYPREPMIALKGIILTKLLFKFLFICIYELRNWFSISNFSNLNEMEKSVFESFYSIVIIWLA